MIDSHCHLDFKNYDGKRERMVAEANAAGVHTIFNIGIDLASSKRSIELAERFECVYATVGVHPHDAKTLDDYVLSKLSSMAEHEKVMAIGEVGLDYYRDLSPRDIQKKVFRAQLELAVDKKLPIVIHTRDSFDDTYEIVTEYVDRLAGGIFHCFQGDTATAHKVFDLGFYISVGGITTFKNSDMSRVAAEVPLERVLLETDSPFLTPVPFRGKTNQPAYVKYVCERVAELRGMSPDEVERITDANCRRFFRLGETFEG